MDLAAFLREAHEELQDEPLPDTAEQVYISGLALLKMLKHARSGVPFEVMGLMLGQFVDDYTVRVKDVFAMPQAGTSVSVESFDEVFQENMMYMLSLTKREEYVVGWYHSHPGFDCWLSGTDQMTHASFQAMDGRCVAVVVDPIQSVRGKVCIDAFRLMDNPLFNSEPLQTTSVLGYARRADPPWKAITSGLGRSYYNIIVNFKQTDEEQDIINSLNKRPWMEALEVVDAHQFARSNVEAMKKMDVLTKSYFRSTKEEILLTKEQMDLRFVGKVDPKKKLELLVEKTMADNVVQELAKAMDSVALAAVTPEVRELVKAMEAVALLAGPESSDLPPQK